MRFVTSRCAVRLVCGFAVVALLAAAAGCDLTSTPVGEVAPLAATGDELRVGLGWSNAANPAEAARQAGAAALGPLGRFLPDLLLVWDNWASRQDAADGLAALSRLTPRRAIYGGHVAWPVASRWSPEPSVCVLALGGGWSVRAAQFEGLAGAEREAGKSLADALADPADVAQPPSAVNAAQPPSAVSSNHTRGRVCYMPAANCSCCSATCRGRGSAGCCRS